MHESRTAAPYLISIASPRSSSSSQPRVPIVDFEPAPARWGRRSCWPGSPGTSSPSIPTIGVEFQTRRLTLRRKRVKAQIWDTAGQERYRAVTSAYYRGALGAMVVYDVTRRPTFEHVARWVEELRAHADGNAVVALIGNKADMPARRREVGSDEAARFAEEQGLFFSEASALTGGNVERAFLTLLEEVFAVVSRRALELDEARRTRNGGGGGGEVLSLKGTRLHVDDDGLMETSAMKKSSQCACS